VSPETDTDTVTLSEKENIMANLDFDANNVEPSAPMTPIPPDQYEAMITESEMKATAAGTGQRLAMTWTITDGEFKGRKVWSNLNLDNPNATAVEIARKDLSAICHAVGKLRVSDSAELHNIPCIIHVIVKPGDGQYSPRNEIKGYSSLSGATAPRSTVPPVAKPAAAGAAASTGKPPWARKAS
jgi:hypothetical protein